MFPWTKSFIENNNKFEPKTIFFGSEGANVVVAVDLLMKKLISQIDEKDYHNLALEQIASPNFYLLKADEGKSFITMDQLRTPKDFLTLNTSKNRVLYIQNAQQIRIDGYNALLKVSEEANENIYIIIATSNLNAVPATILSRFHKVKIAKPLPEEVMIYAKDKGINSEQGVMEFISYNPWSLEDHNEKILDALHSFSKQISDKKMNLEVAEECFNLGVDSIFIDDPRNHLFKEFLRVANIVKPNFIVMEHVQRLYTHNKNKTKDLEENYCLFA